MYQLIHNYRHNDILRASFNELARETFDLSFEDWYQNGFWSDNYDPYSIVTDNQVIANVSVNKTDMLLDGCVKHFLQLGTVMTKEGFRGKGFIREIMAKIEEDYHGENDGVYLFANDSVLSFYPRFGFRESSEYQYARQVSYPAKNQFANISMSHPAAWKRLLSAMDTNVFHGRLDMLHNHGLIMFYVTKFMQENVFYHQESDTYVIAELEGDTLILHNVLSKTIPDLETVLSLFGESIHQVILGFTPLDATGFEVMPLREEDCTFFIKGETLSVIENEKMRIPSLSHA